MDLLVRGPINTRPSSIDALGISSLHFILVVVVHTRTHTVQPFRSPAPRKHNLGPRLFPGAYEETPFSIKNKGRLLKLWESDNEHNFHLLFEGMCAYYIRTPSLYS
jgi:hypothetical protein